MNTNKYVKRLGSVLEIVSIVVLMLVNWKIGILVFLIVWAHNMEYHFDK